MKKKTILFLISVCFLNACSESTTETEPQTVITEPQTVTTSATITLDTDAKKISYGYGFNRGKRLDSQVEDLDLDVYFAGLKDALEKKEAKMTDEEIKETIRDYREKQHQAKRKARKKEKKARAEENKVTGKKYLEENAKKEGVVVLESGLQYKVIQAGSGDKPTLEDSVSVQYRGTLVNGKEFDSSRGKPATLSVKGVIPGWREALLLMQTGAKWMLYVPSELAYGTKAPGKIGPNSTLIFEVELLEVLASSAAGKDQGVRLVDP